MDWINYIQHDPRAAGIWTIALMIAAFFLREWRATRKLSIDDRIAKLAGYAKQVESLMNENRLLRSEILSIQEAHDDYRRLCQKEQDQLRGMVVRLEDELQGIKRRVAQDAIEIAKLKGFQWTDEPDTPSQ